MRVPQDTPMDTKVQCPVCEKSFKAKLALSDDAPIAKTLDAAENEFQPATSETPIKPNVPASGRLKPSGTLPKSARVLKKRRSRKEVVTKGEQAKADSVKPDQPSVEIHAASSEGLAFPSNDPETGGITAGEPQSSQRTSDSSSERGAAKDSVLSGGSRRTDEVGQTERRRSRSSRAIRSGRKDSWNQIGVDGLPLSRSKSDTKPLEEHDGGEGGWREVALIAIGGAISLPVTQLCLWWMVGVDPLQLGPSISRVLPQVVPVAFQSTESRLSSTDNPDVSDPGTTDTDTP